MKSLNKLTNNNCYISNDSYNHNNSFLTDKRNNSYNCKYSQFIDVTWLIDVSHVSSTFHKTSNSCKLNHMIKSKKKSKSKKSENSHNGAKFLLSDVIWHLRDVKNDLLLVNQNLYNYYN